MEAKLGISPYSYPYLNEQKPLVLLIKVYTVFNKIRDKGKTVSAWKRGGGGEREGVGGKGREQEKEGVMTQSLYTHMNKGNFKNNKIKCIFIVQRGFMICHNISPMNILYFNQISPITLLYPFTQPFIIQDLYCIFLW
jgi:hypothetical protein